MIEATDDHRRTERYAVQLPARIRLVESEADEALELLTGDVCSGGAYFPTDAPLPLGTEVEIDIILPLEKLKKIKGQTARVRVSGAVIRTTSGGMAIGFEEDYVISPLS